MTMQTAQSVWTVDIVNSVYQFYLSQHKISNVTRFSAAERRNVLHVNVLLRYD